MKTKLKKVAVKITIVAVLVILFVNLYNMVQQHNVPEVSVEGGVTYLKFPSEKLAELPKEPDWERDADAWEILDEVRKQNEEINNFIKEEVKRSGSSSFVYVNKNGDIMINEEISQETKIHDNIALFRSNSNNLVVIEYTVYQIEGRPVTSSIHRFEYFLTTQQFVSGKKFVSANKQINGSGHYFSVDDTVYYIVKCNEEWKIEKVATGEKISGYVDCAEEDMTYPIILRDNELYTYVVEDALTNRYAYYVESDSVKIKEIKLSEAEGTFTTEQGIFGEDVKGNIEQGKYKVSISVSTDFEVPQTTENFAECCKQIISTHSWILRSWGNDYIFSYWLKDETAYNYFN